MRNTYEHETIEVSDLKIDSYLSLKHILKQISNVTLTKQSVIPVLLIIIGNSMSKGFFRPDLACQPETFGDESPSRGLDDRHLLKYKWLGSGRWFVT